MSDTTNGWPNKPGVPLNPERDGWHWCERDGGLEPRFWSSGQQLWAGLRNSWISPKMLLALFGYAGPCLTPDEATAQQKRIAELEAALRGLIPTALHYGGLRDCDLAAIKEARAALGEKK